MILHRKDANPKGLQHKEFSFKATGVRADGARGKFSGYGSVFDNMDENGEIVARGAFTKSLAEIKAAKKIIPALWQHRSAEPIGGFPDLSEDNFGLKVTDGFLLKDAVVKAAEAFALMEAEVVTGLSIGYFVRKSSFDEKTGVRTLLELDLVEISIVTFPANQLAQVSDVKSIVQSGKLPTLPEFEKFLCETGGFSKSQAIAIAGNGLRKLLRSESDSKSSVLDILNNFKLIP